jgi:hypothetical protein
MERSNCGGLWPTDCARVAIAQGKRTAKSRPSDEGRLWLANISLDGKRLGAAPAQPTVLLRQNVFAVFDGQQDA